MLCKCRLVPLISMTTRTIKPPSSRDIHTYSYTYTYFYEIILFQPQPKPQYGRLDKLVIPFKDLYSNYILNTANVRYIYST